MANPDLNDLLNTLLPFARQMLAEYGEFFPFGAHVARDGSVVHVGAKDEGDDRPPSKRLIDILTNAFRQQASTGGIRAAGICFDVRIIPPGGSQKTDAIQLSLEHESGEAVDVFLPYRRNEDGSLLYGELFACGKDAQFFIGGT